MKLRYYLEINSVFSVALSAVVPFLGGAGIGRGSGIPADWALALEKNRWTSTRFPMPGSQGSKEQVQELGPRPRLCIPS